MPVILRSARKATIDATVVSVAWRSTVLSDLKEKLEKYESKAAQYRKAAESAPDEAGRAFYEGLSSYCDRLAMDFRKVIERRTTASQAAE